MMGGVDTFVHCKIENAAPMENITWLELARDQGSYFVEGAEDTVYQLIAAYLQGLLVMSNRVS